MSDLNIALFQAINGNHGPMGDAIFGIVSGLGDGLIIAVLCTALMLIRPRFGLAALLAFALSGLIAQMLKHIFDLPRPPAVLQNVHVLGAAIQSHSFPSGHATSDGVMIVAAFLLWSALGWRAWLTATLFLLAAYGRIYGGVHFPLDVVAGLGIGMATMWGVWRWLPRWHSERWDQHPWCWKLAGLALAIESGVLGLGYSMQPATAQPLALFVSVVALFYLIFAWRLKHGH